MVRLQDMPGIMIIFVLIALIGASGAIALSEFQNSDAVAVDSYAANITENGLIGIDNTTSFLGTQGTIIAVVALIGIVIAGFAFKRNL